MSTLAKQLNQGLVLTGKTAVVSGGTQGIGAAVALRFAQTGANVTIVGRNAKLGASVVDAMKAAAPSSFTPKFEFIEADLSLMSEIKKLAGTLKDRSPTIEYLVECQGGPPTGAWRETSEGHELGFAVQILGRLALAHLLAESGTLRESFVTVSAPNGTKSAAPDLDDLELREAKKQGKYGIIKAATNCSMVTDGYIAEWPERHPTIAASHIFPGVVTTNSLENQGWHWAMVLAFRLAGPVISRTVGNSPTSYAEIPVLIAANPKARDMNLGFSNAQLKDVGRPRWTDEKPEIRKGVWDKLVAMIP